jgi:glycosyltransferase involved in cell wall biosynthesis
MVKKNLSIIISTKNEADNLLRFIKSLIDIEISGLEIIVVDNFSQDKTGRIVKDFGVKFYSFGNERSSQRNFGAKKAAADYLLFLDADMEVTPQVLNECLILIHHQPVAAVIPETNIGQTWFGKIKRLEKQIYQNEPLLEAPRLFKKSAFMKIKGYNPELVAGEDWDLGTRIMKLGKVYRTKTPLIHHENSFFIELKHKWYYSHLIYRYQRLYAEKFHQQQAVFIRWKIFWNKRNLFVKYPLETIGLLFTKCIEYFIYKIAFVQLCLKKQ